MARRRNLRSSRRRLFWARFASFSSLLPAMSPGPPVVSDAFNVLGNFENDYGADLFGFTITRIRGALGVHLDDATVHTRIVYTAGLRVARNADITRFNDAGQTDEAGRQAEQYASDPHADWMFGMVRQHITPSSGHTGTNGDLWWPIDIKGQRRIDELGQTLMLLHGFSTSLDAPDQGNVHTVWSDLQVLCKRP